MGWVEGQGGRGERKRGGRFWGDAGSRGPERLPKRRPALFLTPVSHSIALFHLDEFETAHAALKRAAELSPSSADAAAWLRKAAAELSSEGVGVGPVTPDTSPPPPDTGASSPPLPPPPAYPHQWFQTVGGVEVDVLAKRLLKDAVSITIEPRRLRVCVNGGAAGGSASAPRDYELDVPLWGEVSVARSHHEVTPSKIVVRLAKASPGAWADLAACGPQAAAAPPTLGDGGSASGAAPSPARAPTYPSSAPRRVDWAAVEAAADADPDPVSGEAALQRFFQDLYKDADEDTRRAMVKSYVESNGTSLSTVWKDVAAKDFGAEAAPPEGQEMRTYEY